LERALEDLGLPPDPQIVAGLERPGELLGGVPESRPHAPGLVAELELEIEVALAVGPKLLVGDQERLVDRISVGELIYVTTSHAGIDSVHEEKVACRARRPARGPIVGPRGDQGQVRHRVLEPPPRNLRQLVNQ